MSTKPRTPTEDPSEEQIVTVGSPNGQKWTGREPTLEDVYLIKGLAYVELPSGKRVTIHYDPAKYSPAFLVKSRGKGLETLLAAIVMQWDLLHVVDEKGKKEMYPITEESIAQLGMKFINMCVTAINRDMNPNDESSSEFDDTD